MATLTVHEKPEPNRSRCFICDQLIVITIFNQNQTDFDNLKRKSKVCQIFGSLISRFLNFNASSTTTTNISKPGKTLNINRNSTLVTSTQQLKICDGCFSNVEIFCDIYAYWKHLKLELIDKVKEMATLMRKIKNTNDPKPLHVKVRNSKTEAFRRKFLTQVDKMIIKDYPQLKLKRLADIDEVEKDDDLFVPVVVKKRPQPQQSRKSSVTVADLKKQNENTTASNFGNRDLDLGQPEDASVIKTPSISNVQSLRLPIPNLKTRSRKKLYYTDRKKPAPKISTDKIKQKATPKNRFKCRFCERRFSTWQSCQVHQGRIHKDKTRQLSLVCRFCQKTFTHISKCLVHERIHTGEKPFRCDLCWKNFTQRGQLVRHILNFHGVDKNEMKRLIEKDRERILAEQGENQPENSELIAPTTKAGTQISKRTKKAPKKLPIQRENGSHNTTSITATTPSHHNGDVSFNTKTPQPAASSSSCNGENDGNVQFHDHDVGLPFGAGAKIEFESGAHNNDNYTGHFGAIVPEAGVTALDHHDAVANSSIILPTIDTNCNGFAEEEMDFDGFTNSTYIDL